MERNEIISVLVFLAALFGLSYLASHKSNSADREAATAVAIYNFIAEWIPGEEVLHGRKDYQGDLQVCTDGLNDLDLGKIAKGLEQTIIRPVSITACNSETVEGDFGMFTALTYYFAPDGEEAAYVKIDKIECPTMTRCIVDLDYHGGGVRYLIQKDGSGWEMAGGYMRWVV